MRTKNTSKHAIIAVRVTLADFLDLKQEAADAGEKFQDYIRDKLKPKRPATFQRIRNSEARRYKRDFSHLGLKLNHLERRELERCAQEQQTTLSRVVRKRLFE